MQLYDSRPIYNDRGEHSVSIVLGRIVRIHVNESVLVIDLDLKPHVDYPCLKPISRAGGDKYILPGNTIDLPRH